MRILFGTESQPLKDLFCLDIKAEASLCLELSLQTFMNGKHRSEFL